MMLWIELLLWVVAMLAHQAISLRLQLPGLTTMREGSRDELDPVALFPNGGGLPVEFPGFEL
jgi:hypothetical protein